LIHSDFVHAVLIFGLTFVLEDLAVLGAALLVVNNMVSLPWAAGSSFAGIWFGDLGLYFLALHYGRPVLQKPLFKRFLGKVDLTRSEAWFQNHGAAAILLSRAIPGTRLPAYLAAGLLKVPVSRFVAITAGAVLVWVAGLFWLSWHVGMMVISSFQMFRSEAGKLVACAVVAAALGWLLRSAIKKASAVWLVTKLRRMLHWEFWPQAIFYIPVAAKYLLLALRYRSFSLPTLANPGMLTGGLIGESKFETLADIACASPQFVAETWLVRFESVDAQSAKIQELFRQESLEYPVVFKPNVGQRGDGFKLIHSEQDARDYVERFSRDVLVQRYAPGPHEAGVFYYRFPDEDHGRILGITDKAFPVVVGDGVHTLEGLIRGDSRASLVASVYLKRFAADRDRVLAAGEPWRLVEAGNHCQGAISLDGGRLFTPELERTIDQIARSVNGFFVGRFDIRYASEEALGRGREFQIIELNGASSEATNIYDPRNSVVKAWRTLFRQWEIIFAIAHQNRKRGLRPDPWKTVWREWVSYRKQAASYSVSD
jgi:membrane protein DedA with SNARE-associated domain